MGKLRNMLALVTAALITTLIGGVGSAYATFPGTNGRIAFDSLRTGTENIFSMRSDGSDVKQLTFLTSGEASGPAWSPDANSIAFQQGAADFSTSQIMLMGADGANPHAVFNDPSFQDGNPSFSPDGRRLIFQRCSAPLEACAIYTIKTDGRGLTAITHFNQSVSVNDVAAKYAPDGKTIAFGSFTRGGVLAAIYVLGTHSANIREITPSALEGFAPDWSPAGTTIAFSSNCCLPASAIWSVQPDGKELTQLTFPGTSNDLAASYSPQGDAIAFQRLAADLSTSVVMTMPAAGGSPTPIQSDAGDPSWGPAGP